MQINSDKLKAYLVNNVFQQDIVLLKNINRGGSSLNFLCKTEHKSYIVKAIKKEKQDRAIRLCQILKALKKEPHLYTAHLEIFNNQDFFEYENWLIIILSYIDGKRVLLSNLDTKLIDKIYVSYQHISKLDIPVSPQKNLEQISSENKQILQELMKKEKSFIRNKVLKLINMLNEAIETNVVLNQDATIIHGDASLNNCLIDHQQNIALLDFELMRYGYKVEDWAEFFISSLSQHAILFIPQKRLKNLILHTNTLFNFSKQEWIYGINLYFLNLIQKRIRSKKLFKSTRKALLFTLNLKKYKVLLNMINSLY